MMQLQTVSGASRTNKLRAHLRSDVTKNIVAMLGEKLLLLVNGVVVTSYIARQLGPENWAPIAWCIAACAILMPIAGAIQPLLLRHLLEKPDQARSSFTTAGVMSALMCIPLALIAFGLLWFMENPARSYLPGSALLLASVIIRPLGLVEAYFQARLLMHQVAGLRMASTIISSTLKLIAVTMGGGVNEILLIFAIEQAVGTLALFVLVLSNGARVKPRGQYSQGLARKWSKVLLPTIISSLGVALYLRADQLMLANYVTRHELGNYSVAVLFAEAPFFLATAIVGALTPRLTRIFDEGRGEERYLIKLGEITTILVGVGLIIAAFMYLLGPVVIRLLLGHQYASAEPYVRILAWSVPFVFMGSLQASATVLYARQNLAVLRLVLAAVTNIAANLILMPMYGAMAAACTTVAAQSIAAWLGNYVHPASRAIAKQQTAALFCVPMFRWAHQKITRNGESGELNQ
jgi:O-antigen/teichoic acid export membrane protein